MKKLTILFILSVVIFSCRKNSGLSDTALLKFNNSAITQVVNEKNSQLQKNMYAALSANEKFELWDKKFANLVATGSLNTQQKQFLVDVKKLFTPGLFEAGSDKKGFDGEKIKNKGIEFFGVQEAFNILASINQQPISNLWSANCSCSVASPWCGNGTCGYDNCNTSSLGCGTLLLSPCNGLCRYPIIKT